MSACGIGIDLVEVAAVEEAIATHGQRYLNRVYTPGELADCGAPEPRAERLAARFAAKEATIKALSLSEDFPLLREIEVVRQLGGAPSLKLHGAAARHGGGATPRAFAVSLTHEAGVAAAVVIAMPIPQQEPTT